jgi:imidazolonepropionase-like amidohydrolase
VILKNGKIINLGKSILNNNYTIIDGTDKYLIPGLIDSHVHLKESKTIYFYI